MVSRPTLGQRDLHRHGACGGQRVAPCRLSQAWRDMQGLGLNDRRDIGGDCSEVCVEDGATEDFAQ